MCASEKQCQAWIKMTGVVGLGFLVGRLGKDAQEGK